MEVFIENSPSFLRAESEDVTHSLPSSSSLVSPLAQKRKPRRSLSSKGELASLSNLCVSVKAKELFDIKDAQLSEEEAKFFDDFRKYDFTSESSGPKKVEQTTLLTLFFQHIRKMPPEKHQFICEHFLIYTLSASHGLRYALLSLPKWHNHLFSLMARSADTPHSSTSTSPSTSSSTPATPTALSPIRERSASRGNIMNLEIDWSMVHTVMAVVGQMVKWQFIRETGFGKWLVDTLNLTELHLGGNDHGINGGRRLLHATIKAIDKSTSSFKHNFLHISWDNLFDYLNVLHDFIFYRPIGTASLVVPGSDEYKDKEVGLHVVLETGCLEYTTVEFLVHFLQENLNVTKLTEVLDVDEKTAVKQKEIRAKLMIELDFWAQLEDLLRSTQSKLFKSLADAKEMISNLVDADSRRQYHVPKKKLEECLNAYVIMLVAGGARRRQFRPTRAQTREGLSASPVLTQAELEEIQRRGGVGRRSSAPAPPFAETILSPSASGSNNNLLSVGIDRLNEMKTSPRWQQRRVSGPQTLESLAAMKLALKVHVENSGEDGILLPRPLEFSGVNEGAEDEES